MDATPEDRLGLSNDAVEALHITVLALRTASTPTPTHEAQGANSVAIDLLGQVDLTLAYAMPEFVSRWADEAGRR